MSAFTETSQFRDKPLCKYGSKCYRKNPEHLKQYRHVDTEGPPVKRPRTENKDTTKAVIQNEKISNYFKTENTSKTQSHNIVTNISPHTSTSTSKPSNHTQDATSKCIVEAAKESAGERDKNSCPNVSSGQSTAQSDICSFDDGDVPGLDSPIDIKENIKQKYQMEMPEDFYHLWDFCKSLKSDKPTEALKNLLGFTLTGPYDIINCTPKNPRRCQPNYKLHSRYYYDPPEFLTVIKGNDSDESHIGYYRDDPSEMPAYVASNSAKLGSTLTPKGDNLFAALKYFISERLKHDELSSTTRSELVELQTKVMAKATEHGYCLDLRSAAMKIRDKRVVCKTMNGAGIVVPVDDNDVGYRPVPETLSDLKKMLKRIADSQTPSERDKNFEPLQQLITLVQFANDESDYGEGLELGLQLFCFGHETFHAVISHLLPLAYELLNRQQYADIIRTHLKHRQCKCYANQFIQ